MIQIVDIEAIRPRYPYLYIYSYDIYVYSLLAVTINRAHISSYVSYVLNYFCTSY